MGHEVAMRTEDINLLLRMMQENIAIPLKQSMNDMIGSLSFRVDELKKDNKQEHDIIFDKIDKLVSVKANADELYEMMETHVKICHPQSTQGGLQREQISISKIAVLVTIIGVLFSATMAIINFNLTTKTKATISQNKP